MASPQSTPLLTRFFYLAAEMLAVLNRQDLHFVAANTMFCELSGWRQDEIRQKTLTDLVAPGEESLWQGILRNLEKGHSVFAERPIRTQGENAVLVRWRLYPEKDSPYVYIAGRPGGELALHDLHFKMALDIAPTGILVVDRQGVILYATPLIEKVTGYHPEELTGHPVEELLPEHLSELHINHRENFFETPYVRPMGTKGLNLAARRKDGAIIPVDIGLSPIYLQNGLTVIVSIIDLSLRKQQEAKHTGLTERLQKEVVTLRQAAEQDALTGLANRRALRTHLDRQVHLALDSGQPLAYVMLDIDDFKSYNDTYGHPAGDEILRILGALLRNNVRTADLPVRYGGEEFALVMPNTDADRARQVLTRLRTLIHTTPWPQRKITLSFGAAVYHPQSDSHTAPEQIAEMLIARADNALYQAKRQGKDCIVFWSAENPQEA